MKTRITVSIMALALILFGCEENDVIRTSEIPMGDNSNMILCSYDTTLIGAYHQPKTYDLDLDKDGNDDIQFESNILGSPAVGQHPISIIRSLSYDVQMYGIHSSDTSFLHRDTSVYTGANNIIEIYHYNNYTCHRIAENDSILEITPTFNLIPLDKGDVLKMSDTYNSDTIVLIHDYYAYPPLYDPINGDTTIIENTSFYEGCNDFPLDEIKYIGVRFENESRLGWIKVSVFDQYKILILESGIQE